MGCCRSRERGADDNPLNPAERAPGCTPCCQRILRGHQMARAGALEVLALLTDDTDVAITGVGALESLFAHQVWLDLWASHAGSANHAGPT